MKNCWTVQHIFLGILMDAFFICQTAYNINLQRERRLFQVKKNSPSNRGSITRSVILIFKNFSILSIR